MIDLGFSEKQINELEHFSIPLYRYSKLKGMLRCGVRRILGPDAYSRSKYDSVHIMDSDETNSEISRLIDTGNPFLVGRFGDAELRCLVYYLERRFQLRDSYPDYIRHVMHMNAGFFPVDDESLDKFSEYLLAASGRVDLFGVWYNLLEDYVISHFASDPTLAHLEALEPYRCAEPWSGSLEGKRVLVINPFSESIQLQYKKRNLLFLNSRVLPDFELLTYRSVQTNAGSTSEYNSWFAALDAMYADITKIDFDIAIVGCGSYGLPLSALLKDLGKQVVHLGGATQIMFGVKGARWENKPEVARLFNEHWVRPSAAERPPQIENVEGGCYW